MNQLPAQPHLDHLKKQAKDLLRLYRSRDPASLARFRANLPAAAGKDDAAIAALDLRLRDAQWCVAREYGFSSWADLKSYVEAQAARSGDRRDRVLRWLERVYAGDIAGGNERARPAIAARMLAENSDLIGGDAYLACATGDEALLRRPPRLAAAGRRHAVQPGTAAGLS
jgi:hypothetical protein